MFEKGDRVKLKSFPSKMGEVRSPTEDIEGNVLVCWNGGGTQKIALERLMPEHTENQPSTHTDRESWFGFTEGESEPRRRQ